MSKNETPKWLTPPTRADLERAFARIDVPAELERIRAAEFDSSNVRDVVPPPAPPRQEL